MGGTGGKMKKENVAISWEWMVNIEKQYAGVTFLTCMVKGRRLSVTPKSQYDMPFTRTSEPCGIVGVKVLTVPTDFKRFKVVSVTKEDRKKLYSPTGLGFGTNIEAPNQNCGVALQEIIDFTERFKESLAVLPEKVSMDLVDWERLSELQHLPKGEE